MGILLIGLIYCHFNTFLGNDDFPYSFFRRLNQRVTNLFQVVWDNLRYYKSTNGRFIIHCIVMTLLIFGKNLWSILNPIIIVTTLIFIYKIIFDKESKDDKLKILVTILSSSLFLSMIKIKPLIYWVTGSVNYIWCCCFIIIYSYLYLKKDIFKYKKTNIFLLFILSTLHENVFVFFVIFIVTLNVIEFVKNKKLTYWKYILPVLLGGAILLLSPGNIMRSFSDSTWYSLNLFERLNISIPAVSKGVFSLFNVILLIPTIYIFIVLIKVLSLKIKLKFKITIAFVIVICVLLAYFDVYKYSYFTLSIVMFLTETYIHIFEKKYTLIPVQFGFYAIAFSMILTPLYGSLRPNILLYIYFILIICMFTKDILRKKWQVVSALLILIPIFILLFANEINVYYHIGSCYRERLKQIEKFKKGNEDVLYLKIIPEKYTKYHIDSNVVNENFWTYEWFIWYYDLPEGTKIYYR